MGKLLTGYKKAVYDEIINSISSNASNYYAFAANPVTYGGNMPVVTSDDYHAEFLDNWELLFGKKLSNTNILPVIKNIAWSPNTVYTRYDNTTDLSNSNFYVITPPSIPGGYYNVYKCIDNNGNTATGNVSSIPTQVQTGSFHTPGDNYLWKYITSISTANYNKFAASGYVPIYANTVVASSAANNSGVEVVALTSGGTGYKSYGNGYVRGVTNSTLIQIESFASSDNDFYTKNGIWLYNTNATNPGVFTVSKYVSNTSGNWVYLDQSADTQLIVPTQTQYVISPKVVFQTDGTSDPIAITSVNTQTNSISSVIMLDNGTAISWANVQIVSNTNYGTGANAYAIVPPPGGHGSSPAEELYMQGMSVAFTFANSETNGIPTNVLYNKIGLLKNPYQLNANGTKSSTSFTNTTFSAVLRATVTSGNTMTVGTQVVGQTTTALGTVAFANSSTVYLTGDKYFTNETIIGSDGKSAQITINTNGDVYPKDLRSIYVQNISDVNRANTQSESFKLIIQV